MDLQSRSNDLDRMSKSADRIQEEVDDLVEQRRTLVAGMNKLQQEKATLEDAQRVGDKRIDKLKR